MSKQPRKTLQSFYESAEFPTRNMYRVLLDSFFHKDDTLGSGNIDDEAIDDRVAALIQAGENITVNYDDDNDVLIIHATAPGQATELIFNNDGSLAASSKLTYDTDTDVLGLTGYRKLAESSSSIPAAADIANGESVRYVETETINTNTHWRLKERSPSGEDIIIASRIL